MTVELRNRKKRYTAIIKIVEVTEGTVFDGSGSYAKAIDKHSKDTELASITVRAGDLETLKSDIAAHVALVKDMSHGAVSEV